MAGNTVQLYVNDPTTNKWLTLDLMSADPIKLTLQASSIEDPLKVASAFSREFRVPNTRKNAQFFKTAFNVNTEDFNPAIKIASYINDTGGTLVSGNVRLNNVIRGDERQAIYYDIGFFGETSDFGSVIQGRYMNQMKLIQYTHVRNYQAINNSWTTGVFPGPYGPVIRYPLVEWGYLYDGSTPPIAITPTLTNGFARSFTTSTNALSQSQFKPAIQLKALWDAIISPSTPVPPSTYPPTLGFSGYTYSSDSFMNSQIFSSMYVLMETEARAFLPAQQVFTANVTTPPTQSFPAFGAVTKVFFTQEVSDPANNYDPSSSTYTAPVTGTYTFNVRSQGICYNSSGTNITNTSSGSLRLKLTTPAGVVTWLTYFSANPINTFGNNLSTEWNPTVSIATAGTTIEAFFYVGAVTVVAGFKLNSGHFKCTSSPSVVNVQSLMPGNIKVADFVKSIVDRFKLVFIPNKDRPKEFKIIPWVEWIKQGKTRDWSAFLDTSKEFKITPLWEGQTRNNVYVDAEDGDYINFNYKQSTKEVYGQLFQDSGNELLVGETRRESIFAPTPIDSIDTASASSAWKRVIIPKLSVDSQNERGPIIPKPRLLFWNGLIPNNSGGAWHIKNDANANIPVIVYPLLSEFQQWPAQPSSLNLTWTWKPPVYDPAFGPTANPTALTDSTVYGKYWSQWYESVYNNYSKAVEAYFTLDYAELKDFNFNDYVWVKDAWYLVDKIQDYIVGQSTTVKVKMYKISGSLGLTIPNAVNTIPSVSLCFGTTACAAKCCVGSALATTSYFTQTPTAMVANLSQLFSDPYGNVPAPAGFYKYSATVIWEIGPNGVFLGSSNPSCNCITNPSTPTALRVAYAPTNLDSVACASPIVPPTEVNIFGKQSNEFDDNVEYYQEAACINPAPTGYYRYLDYVVDTGSIIYLEDGVYTRSLSTELGYCKPTLYPYILGFDPNTDCGACCFENGSAIYYSADSTLVPGSVLYSDLGDTFAPEGFYSDGTFYWILDTGNGEVISSADCVCSCSPTEPIGLSFESEFTGAEGTIDLYKSLNATDWVYVGTLDFPDTTPANIPVNTSFEVEIGNYLKAVANYAGGAGGFQVIEYLIGGTMTSFRQDDLPFPDQTLITEDTVDSIYGRKFEVKVYQ